MKILIISDSHSKNDWLELRKYYDYVVHGGDHQMSKEWMINNVDYYVDGNNDWGEKKINTFEIDGINFCLIHGDGYDIKNKNNWSSKLLDLAIEKKSDVLIYGHTHVPNINFISNILFINPGSISKPRFPSSTKTFCELEIENGKIKKYEIKTLSI